MVCRATPENHCCWLPGGVCPFFDPVALAEGNGGCSLRAELGSWDAVHKDPRYLRDVAPHWPQVDYCGAYPVNQRCATCGVGA